MNILTNAHLSIKQFVKDETGAVTVDWVVLTAATVGITIAMLVNVSTGLGVATESITCNLEKAEALPDALPGLCGGGTVAPPAPSPTA